MKIFAPISAGARNALIILIGLGLALNMITIIFSAREVGALRSAVQAQCLFDADLGGVPVMVNPATGKAAKLGVTIISDARVAWYGLGCPGALAPPSPSFRKWAEYYRLPYN
jgi:hypothetical protein